MESSKEVLCGLGFAYIEMQLWLKNSWKKVSMNLCNETLTRMFLVKWMSLVVNTVYPNKGVWVGEMGFCCSKSRQQLVSTRSTGIMTWGTISAVFLLSTVCILWSFSLCCCMTANPVTAELQQLSVLSIKHVDQNEAGVLKTLGWNRKPLKWSCFHFCHHDMCSGCQANLNILSHELYSHDLCRPCWVS